MRVPFEATISRRLPLVALHLQAFRVRPEQEDMTYDETRRVNISPDGGLSCARSAKIPTSALTPGHTIKGGYTPSGKYRTPKFVPSKMDKRAGK